MASVPPHPEQVNIALDAASAVACAMAFIVLRQDPSLHPSGVRLAAAVLWRGLLCGAADGLLLSSFPILAVLPPSPAPSFAPPPAARSGSASSRCSPRSL